VFPGVEREPLTSRESHACGAEGDSEGDEEIAFIAHPRRPWWRVAALVLVAMVVLVVSRVPLVQAWARGELDWRGQRVYEPQHPPALEHIDLQEVHAELLPRWLVAQGQRADGHSGAVAAESAAFAELRNAVAPDANLVALLDELHALSPPAQLARAPRRALYLMWAWSHYLERQGAPFLVQGSVRALGFGPLLTATSHHVLDDAEVAVGAGSYRVRITTRLDRTNVREQYLGAAGQESALIVVDRLRDFAFEEVWPLLDPWLELPVGTHRSFAEAIRTEARARLSPAAMKRLEQTAAARWSMIQTMRTIEARRRDCDSGFRIEHVPWSGLPPDQLVRLATLAQRHAARDCPGITAPEVEELARATKALAADSALQAALEELVALTAEHVAVHEARHLADAERADGFDQPLACASCSAAMGIAARSELSGYLASLAWSPSPALALFQACRSLAADQGRPLAPGEPHRDALELLQRRIGLVCAKGPPEELRALAQLLEHEMLGRSDPIALPESFPHRLPVAPPSG
jgi:hypothetical protein